MKNTDITQKRTQLKEYSKIVKMAITAGAEYETINEGLQDVYKKQVPEIKEFKTFKQWLFEGKRVKKGEKGFLFWARPRHQVKQIEENKTDEFDFFPICYLFANTQVN